MEKIKEFFKQKDPSGKYKNEKYIKNNYKDYYDIIINFANKNNLNEIPFKEKVYHFVYDIKYIIRCENENCNNPVKFKNFTLGYNSHCSKECISKSSSTKKKKIENSLKKYGTTNPQKLEKVKAKIIKTNQERYGSNCPLQNKEIQEKSKKTLLKNYNVENPAHSKEIQEKRIKNFNVEKWQEKFNKIMIKRYGVKSALQNEEIKLKMIKTNQERYGVNTPMKNDKIKNKMIDTVKEKYGVNCTLKNPEIKEKSNKTMIERYGIDNVFKLEKIQKQILENKQDYFKNKIKKTYKAIDTYKNEFNQNIIIKYCNMCKKNYEIEHTLIKNRKKHKTIICTNCNPTNSSKSGLELQILNFIKQNYDGEIRHNSRSIISPLELDIYLPYLKLAIEFNGLWWHNELNKPNNYHKIKSDLCDKINIKLIHIWEDDWKYKNDIIKNYILKYISKKEEIKNFNIKKVNNIKEFSNNCINGYVKSDINLGLYKDGKLISFLSLNKLGKNYEIINFYETFNSNSLELLFNYLKDNYIFDKIECKLDRSYNFIKNYINLGFNVINISEPNYSFIINNKRIICENIDNYYKIYDSGKYSLLYT